LTPNWVHQFLRSNAVYLGAYFLLSLTAWFLANEANAAASRWLSNPASFGDFNMALRQSHFFAHLFVMGQEATILMFLSKYYPHDLDKSSGLVRWIIQSTVIKTAALLLLIKTALYYHAVFPFYHVPKYVLISYAAMPFIVISGIYERFFLFMQSFFTSFLPRGIYQPVIFMILLLSLPQSTPKDPIYALYIYIFTFVVASLVYTLHSYFCGFKFSPTPNYEDLSNWRKSGLLYTLSTLIIKGTPSMAIFLLETYGTDEKAVGFFAALATLNYGFHLLTKPFDSYLKPSIAKLYHSNQIDTLQRKINRINIIRWSIITALALILILAGPLLLARYGPEFPMYYDGLVIVACLSFFQYLGQVAHEILNYTGNQATLSKIMVLQLIAIGIIGRILIPNYGIYGAIWAQGIPCLVSVLWSAFFLRKATNLKLFFVF
jgi:O-antigen/teichoic acid export membrane protein